MEKISVLIPAYNEAENLPLLLEKIQRAFDQMQCDEREVLIVDDGSTDNTKGVLESLKQQYQYIKVVVHHRNRGLAEVFNTSFEQITGSIVVFLPADLQSDPEVDMPKLVNKLNEENLDVVVGWRQKWSRSRTKVIESKIYSFLTRKLFHIPVHDFNWIRAYRKEVTKEMKLTHGWHRYFVVLAASKGYKVGEVKVDELKRQKGSSKFKFGRVVTGFLDLITMKLFLSFKEKPMLFFGGIGILLIIVGMILGAYLTTLFFFGDQGVVSRPLFFLTTMLIISGVVSFSLGFLGELIVHKGE